MKKVHKIGAIFFVLWGVLHIAGGCIMLSTTLNDGARAGFMTVATANGSDTIPEQPGAIAESVLLFHAWNLIWFGLAATVIGVWLNWKNNRLGFWFNFTILAASDLGMIVTLLLPGYITVAEGLLGPGLWLLAAAFGWWGLRQAGNETNPNFAA